MIDQNSLIKHYYAIANKLDDMMPVEWDKIIMYAEESGRPKTPIFYFHAKEYDRFYYSRNIADEFFINEDVLQESLLELNDYIKGLWNEFENLGEKLWCTLTVRFEVNGKFNAEFGYNLDDKIGEHERELVWAYNELGILPENEQHLEFIKGYVSKKL